MGHHSGEWRPSWGSSARTVSGLTGLPQSSEARRSPPHTPPLLPLVIYTWKKQGTFPLATQPCLCAPGWSLSFSAPTAAHPHFQHVQQDPRMGVVWLWPLPTPQQPSEALLGWRSLPLCPPAMCRGRSPGSRSVHCGGTFGTLGTWVPLENLWDSPPPATHHHHPALRTTAPAAA